MRVGNGSWTTPAKFFTKLTEQQIELLKTKALLLNDLHSNDGYESFTADLPTWYSVYDPEDHDCLKFNGRTVRVIYLDTNDFSAKPGVIAKWIIRIYH